MIEFKQIIGRGTRLYDGKDHFTIYDFVKAHHHFSDPEWDGEPLPPAEPDPRPPRTGNSATDVPAGEPTPPPYVDPPPAKIKVKLADGKERKIQHMTATTFWSADGRPMAAAQFLQVLFGALPEFFKDEDDLRRIWSAPDTRKALLAGLAEKGFGREPLFEMQKVIEAENSDLFDVLAYVAFAAEPVSRAARASVAHAAAATEFTDKPYFPQVDRRIWTQLGARVERAY
jgi:type I restriction enzyme R subunit